MKKGFKFLERRYFWYPLKDKGKKFEVLDTISLYHKDQKTIDLLKPAK